MLLHAALLVPVVGVTLVLASLALVLVLASLLTSVLRYVMKIFMHDTFVFPALQCWRRRWCRYWRWCRRRRQR